MKPLSLIPLCLLAVSLVLNGCAPTPPAAPVAKTTTTAASSEADEREAALAALGADDRALAEAQGYCAVTGEPLGSMGPPLKLSIQDESVFICCKGCEKRALGSPEKTLATAAEHRAKVAAGPSK